MKLTLQLNGKTRNVELARTEKGLVCSVDGAPVNADITEIFPGAYSILIGGHSLEAHIAPRANELVVTVAGREYTAAVRDPREWKRKHGDSFASEGRQQIVAPMPGKVVRIL